LQNVETLGSHIFMSFQRILLKLRKFTTFDLIRRAVRLISLVSLMKKRLEKRDIVEVVLIKIMITMNENNK